MWFCTETNQLASLLSILLLSHYTLSRVFIILYCLPDFHSLYLDLRYPDILSCLCLGKGKGCKTSPDLSVSEVHLSSGGPGLTWSNYSQTGHLQQKSVVLMMILVVVDFVLVIVADAL